MRFINSSFFLSWHTDQSHGHKMELRFEPSEYKIWGDNLFSEISPCSYRSKTVFSELQYLILTWPHTGHRRSSMQRCLWYDFCSMLSSAALSQLQTTWLLPNTVKSLTQLSTIDLCHCYCKLFSKYKYVGTSRARHHCSSAHLYNTLFIQ